MKRFVKVFLLLVTFSLAGCSDPSVSLNTHIQDGHTVFDISSKGVNGLLDLEVRRAGSEEVYWAVSLSYFHGSRLVYGEIPKDFSSRNGSLQSAKQSFPPDDSKPKQLPPNSRLHVRIGYQHDEFLSASMSLADFYLTTDSNGEVTSVAPASGNQQMQEKPNKSLQPTPVDRGG